MDHLRNRHFLVADLLLIPLVVYSSFVLRLEQLEPGQYLPGLLLMALAAGLVTPLFLFWAGIYQQYWRYASAGELLQLFGVVTLAGVTIGLVSLAAGMLLPALTIPRSVPLIVLPLLLGAVATPRLLLRIWSSRMPRHEPASKGQPVLIMGAGDTGAMTVRELRYSARLKLRVVGLLDDDPAKRGMCIHGVIVLGDRSAIPALVRQYGIATVIIAMPTAPGKEVRAILQICRAAGVQTLTVPGFSELLDGRTSVSQLRQIEISDLLRRAPVQTDIAAVHQLIQDRVVMVTGGGGSIGSELCRQVLRAGPAELILLGHGENSVFEAQNELAAMARECAPTGQAIGVKAVIADIRDARRLQATFERYRPSIVFHAAAHKHVPLMEENPVEAITNNVLGTRNLLNSAVATGVEHFVMISSDKAVNPTSVMGASKRVAEMLVLQTARTSGRPFVAVRFGNVLGSRGSVVLTFKRQIAAGGPVTVTHPDMRRFFMTIPEAVQLVLQAAVLGSKGEVFMLDMGEPLKVVDLARDMIRLSGLEEGRDIDIAYSGLRPGEKLFEELFAEGEQYTPTCHSKIFIAGNASGRVPSELTRAVAELERSAEENNDEAVLKQLHALVPEYQRPGYPALPVAPASQPFRSPLEHPAALAQTCRPLTPT
jgi:FlaA1/EpsC-like NDP-sugar epimerase